MTDLNDRRVCLLGAEDSALLAVVCVDSAKSCTLSQEE